MKSTIAVIFALLVAGCASGPYYAGSGYGYYDPYPAYSYSYGYGPTYYYDYPVVGGSIFYYDRDDGRHGRWRDGRWRDRDHDRDDDRPRWRDRGGSANSPDLYRPGNAARGRGEAGNEAGM